MAAMKVIVPGRLLLFFGIWWLVAHIGEML
jgi:hypothetical protein